jgi:heme/copper-type cytochrome/quinol oxidase subunit 2
MRGLLFAIFFCAVSLLFARVLTNLLIQLSFIHSHEFDLAHNLIMTIMLIVYLALAPTFSKNAKHHGNENDRK